jgi:hypothetical protein
MITMPFPKRASVRLKILAAFFALLPITQAFAGEKLFSSASIIEEEASYLRDEALDLLRTPTDTEHNGLFGTVMVIGGAGMVYIFDENIRKSVRENGNQTLDKIANVGSAIGNPLVHIGMAGMVYGGGVLAGSQKWQETGKMLGEAVHMSMATREASNHFNSIPTTIPCHPCTLQVPLLWLPSCPVHRKVYGQRRLTIRPQPL